MKRLESLQIWVKNYPRIFNLVFLGVHQLLVGWVFRSNETNEITEPGLQKIFNFSCSVVFVIILFDICTAESRIQE